MGNIMRKQTIYKHLPANTPKLNPTPSPILHSSSQKITCYLDNEVDAAHRYTAYHFGTKKQLKTDQIPTYKLPQSISILTYNIWFEQHNKQNRFPCILKILQQSNADFICLQQVTKQFVDLLHGQPKNGWIKDYYTCVIPMGWYDTLIMSKYQCRFYKVPFKTTYMSRSMLFAQLLESSGKNLIVGCMHYESLGGNQKIREGQIMSVQDVTKKCQRVIIVGDYNLSDGFDQNKVFDKSYTDIWVLVKGLKQDRYTMPQTTRFPLWRPDHILYKAPKQINLKEKSPQIQKIGQFTIPPFQNDDHLKIGHDDIVRTPSDHFGLVAWIPLK